MTFSTLPISGTAYITSVFIGYIGTDSIGSLIKRFAAKKAEEDGNLVNQCGVPRYALAWLSGTDNGRQKTRNHGYDVIVGGELFTDYPDHPRKLVTLNPNSNQQAPDATSFFPVGGCLLQVAYLKDFPAPTYHAQIKERGALPKRFNVVISVRQSTVAAISGLHCRWLWSVRA